MRKLLLIGLYCAFLSLSACGIGGVGDECKNIHPSQKDICGAENKTEWDGMNWNEGVWA